MLSVKGGGIAVADEQGSTEQRHTNQFDKLHLLTTGKDGKVIYGGSGMANDVFGSIYNGSQDRIFKELTSQSLTIKEVSDIVRETIIKYYHEEKDAILRAQHGFSLQDLNSATLSNGRPISSGAIDSARNTLGSMMGHRSLSILLGGMHEDKFFIYGLDNGGHATQFVAPNATIGSGYDESNRVLAGYIGQMPREKRNQIDPKSGLVMAIEATNGSSQFNNGVGGTPSIIYMDGETTYTPSESQCRAASEVVKGLTWGQLTREYAQDAVYGLVVGGLDYGDTIKEMMGSAKSPERFNLLLRDYKE